MKNMDQENPDRLEQRIRDGREQLDHATPRANLWDAISRQLDERQGSNTGSPVEADPDGSGPTINPQIKTIRHESSPVSAKTETAVKGRMRTLMPLLRVAAVLTVLSAVGFWLTRNDQTIGTNPNQPGSITASESIQESHTNDAMYSDPRFAELKNTESEYARLASQRTSILLSNPDLSPEDTQQAIDLIEDLENDYRQLRVELEAGADADKVVEAMVRNYRQRIEVLERMSDLLSPQKESQTNNDYATSIVL